MNCEICGNFIRDMENMSFHPDRYLALLCGSSLVEDDPRDTDIFIYTTEAEQAFAQELFRELSCVDTEARLAYLEALEFYSLKYKSGDVHYSLHIVSVEKLTVFVQKAALTETYTDINVFDVRLYYQTVYRKWILETAYLCGNTALRTGLIHQLAGQKKPVASAKQRLAARLRNNINYLEEKVPGSRVTYNVVLGQIFNNLINYCYLSNNVYYGTVKYIKQDLEGFSVEPELCHLTIDIMESLNRKTVHEFLWDLKHILDYLE